MKLRWDRLGGQIGVGFCLAGFVLVFLGWNGAASSDRIPSQFPYLLSGGIAGLCLVVVGAALMVVQNQRADRALLQRSVDELREALGRLEAGLPAAAAGNGRGPLVLAGETSYHRPGCRLLEGRSGLQAISVDDAVEQGLQPCRACDAAQVGRAKPAPRRAR